MTTEEIAAKAEQTKREKEARAAHIQLCCEVGVCPDSGHAIEVQQIGWEWWGRCSSPDCLASWLRVNDRWREADRHSHASAERTEANRANAQAREDARVPYVIGGMILLFVLLLVGSIVLW